MVHETRGRAVRAEETPASTSPSTPGTPPPGPPPIPRPPGRLRPDPARARWITLLTGLFGLLAGAAVFWPHHSDWAGHNGDHYYYASTALQFAGTGYEQSLRIATDYFDYPYSATQLDLGYLNPVVAPLIYPRVVLGLLAVPTVRAFGIDGIWFPGALCGALSVVLLMVATVRRVGRIGLAAIPLLIAVTRYAPEFMFGIYAESPVILATTLLLMTFPLGRSSRTWWHAVAAGGLVPVMMLSRQVPLLPLGMALGGFAWAWFGSRRARNAWLPFALTVPVATVAGYAVLTWWAPYSTLPFLHAKTGTSTLSGLIGALPDLWSVSIGTDWNHLLDTDVPALVVVGLGLVGFALVLRNPLAGVFLGTLASGAATELLNGQPNDFRYLAPSLPVVLLLAALTLAWAVHQLPRMLGQVARDWPGAALLPGQRTQAQGAVHVLPDGRIRISRPLDPARGPTRRGPIVAAIGAWATVAVVIVATVALHRPAPLSGAAREQVSEASIEGSWPLSVPEGTLVCAGDDYQMWLVTPEGVRYALSGTAMARSLGAPRVVDLASGPPEFAWPQIRPLLSEGMRLCGSSRAFQSEMR